MKIIEHVIYTTSKLKVQSFPIFAPGAAQSLPKCHSVCIIIVLTDTIITQFLNGKDECKSWMVRFRCLDHVEAAKNTTTTKKAKTIYIWLRVDASNIHRKRKYKDSADLQPKLENGYVCRISAFMTKPDKRSPI